MTLHRSRGTFFCVGFRSEPLRVALLQGLGLTYHRFAWYNEPTAPYPTDFQKCVVPRAVRMLARPHSSGRSASNSTVGSELVLVLGHVSPYDGVLALVHIRTAIAQHEGAIVGMGDMTLH
jgi:hypothetical protein